MSDGVFLSRLRSNDVGAWEDLSESIYPRVFSFVKSLAVDDREIPRHFINSLHRLRWYIQNNSPSSDEIVNLVCMYCKSSLQQSLWKHKLTRDAAKAVLEPSEFESQFAGTGAAIRLTKEHLADLDYIDRPDEGLTSA
jgi:hypothetical protein